MEVYFYITTGVEGNGFYLSVVPIIAAGVLLCCGVSCLFDLFEKISCTCSSNMKNKETEHKEDDAAPDAVTRQHTTLTWMEDKIDISCAACVVWCSCLFFVTWSVFGFIL
eukprot:893764_1